MLTQLGDVSSQIDNDASRQTQHWEALRMAEGGALEAQPCPTGVLTLVCDSMKAQAR